MNIQGITENQLITFCHKLQAYPSLIIFYILSVIIFAVSLLLVVDLRNTNINKLIMAGIIFTIFMGGILFFLLSSPMLMNSFY